MESLGHKQICLRCGARTEFLKIIHLEGDEEMESVNLKICPKCYREFMMMQEKEK